MPVGQTPFPILTHFLCAVEKSSGMSFNRREPTPANTTTSPPSNSTSNEPTSTPTKLPKGVVLGPDGKPCRSCTDIASWRAMTRSQKSPFSSSSSSSPLSTNPTTTTTSTTPTTPFTPPTASDPPPPPDCPPDVALLGAHTWTLLHALTASYPPSPTPTHIATTRSFLSAFAALYPCHVCAADFRAWMAQRGNEPRLESREAFGRWMCTAHNEVNRKLGKEEFECGRWEERWGTGWRDGRCD